MIHNVCFTPPRFPDAYRPHAAARTERILRVRRSQSPRVALATAKTHKANNQYRCFVTT
jgi:hypothetical protein